MSQLLDLNTLWIGDELHPIHQLCLLSALRHGHRMRLFCYRAVSGVPAGVEVVSAEEVLPLSAMFVHAKTGSPAPFADRFRVKLISLGLGAWVDADLLFIRPLISSSKNVFGWENEKLVGNAVMSFDREHSAFRMLSETINNNFPIPPWFSKAHRLYLASRRAMKIPKHVRYMSYGTTGPDLLTWCIRSNQMLDQVLHRDVFYSLPYEQKFDVFKPNTSFRSILDLPRNAVAVHLWFQGLVGGLHTSKKSRRSIPSVEPGSLLYETARELGMVKMINSRA